MFGFVFSAGADLTGFWLLEPGLGLGGSALHMFIPYGSSRFKLESVLVYVCTVYVHDTPDCEGTPATVHELHTQENLFKHHRTRS